MAEERKTRDYSIRYYGITDGKSTDRWLLAEFDHEAMLDNLEERERDVDRLVRLPGDRGVLARIHRNIIDGVPTRTLKLYKVEPAGVISLLQGEEVVEYDPGNDASMMYPSWIRVHPGNRIGLLMGPGGAGVGLLREFINGLEPSLIEAVPHRRRNTSTVGFTALLSNADRAAIARSADRVNGLTLSLPPNETVHVGESVVSRVIEILQEELGQSVTVRLEVSASRRVDGATQVANNLQQEVGRIVQSDDLSSFRSAHMKYDRQGRNDIDLDLLAAAVTARVPVLLGPRGVLTDSSCSHALTEAWVEAEDRLPWAVASDEDSRDDRYADDDLAEGG